MYKAVRFLNQNPIEIVCVVWLVFLGMHLLLNGRIWVWELVSAIPSIFFLIIPIVLVCIALSASKHNLSVIMLVSALILLPQSDVHLPQINAVAAGEYTQVSLFNWNTEYWVSDDEKIELASIFRSHPADIYHFQEVITKQHEPITDTILPQLLAGYEIVQIGELITATRFPVLQYFEVAEYVMRVDVAIDGQAVSLYNVHIPVHINPGKLSSGPVGFLSDVQARYYWRQREFALLEKELKGNDNLKIISGDFNTPTNLAAIHKLTGQYTEAFSATQSGYPTTYSFGNLELWRIDYVLGDKVEFLDYEKLGDFELSDHQALWVVVGI